MSKEKAKTTFKRRCVINPSSPSSPTKPVEAKFFRTSQTTPNESREKSFSLVNLIKNQSNPTKKPKKKSSKEICLRQIKKGCGFPGCDGKGNTTGRKSHRSLKNCPYLEKVNQFGFTKIKDSILKGDEEIKFIFRLPSDLINGFDEKELFLKSFSINNSQQNCPETKYLKSVENKNFEEHAIQIQSLINIGKEKLKEKEDEIVKKIKKILDLKGILSQEKLLNKQLFDEVVDLKKSVLKVENEKNLLRNEFNNYKEINEFVNSQNQILQNDILSFRRSFNGLITSFGIEAFHKDLNNSDFFTNVTNVFEIIVSEKNVNSNQMELDELKEKNISLEHKNSLLKSQLDELLKETEKDDSMAEEYVRTNNSLQCTNENLNKKMVDIKEGYESSISNLENEIDDYKEKLKLISAKLENSLKQIDDKDEENKKLRKETNMLQNSILNNQKLTVEAINKLEITKFSNQYDENKSVKFEDLVTELNKNLLLLAESKHKIIKLEIENSDLKIIDGHNELERIKLKNELELKNDFNKELKCNYDQIVEKLNEQYIREKETDKKLNESARNESSLRLELETLSFENTYLKKQIEEKDKAFEILENKSKISNEFNDNFKIEMIESRLKITQEENCQLKISISELEFEFNRSKSELHNMEKNLSETLNEFFKVKEGFLNELKSNNKLRNELSRLELNNKLALDENQNLLNENRKLDNNIKEFEKENKVLSEKNTEFQIFKSLSEKEKKMYQEKLNEKDQNIQINIEKYKLLENQLIMSIKEIEDNNAKRIIKLENDFNKIATHSEALKNENQHLLKNLNESNTKLSLSVENINDLNSKITNLNKNKVDFENSIRDIFSESEDEIQSLKKTEKGKCPVPGCDSKGNTRSKGEGKSHRSIGSCPNRNLLYKQSFQNNNDNSNEKLVKDLNLRCEELNQQLIAEKNKSVFYDLNKVKGMEIKLNEQELILKTFETTVNELTAENFQLINELLALKSEHEKLSLPVINSPENLITKNICDESESFEGSLTETLAQKNLIEKNKYELKYLNEQNDFLNAKLDDFKTLNLNLEAELDNRKQELNSNVTEIFKIKELNQQYINELNILKNHNQNSNFLLENIRSTNLKLESELFCLKHTYENEKLTMIHEYNQKNGENEFLIKRFNQEIENLKIQESNYSNLIKRYENELSSARLKIQDLEIQNQATRLSSNFSRQTTFENMTFDNTKLTPRHNLINERSQSVTINELIKHVRFLESLFTTNSGIPRLVGLYSSNGSACGSPVFIGPQNGKYYLKDNNKNSLSPDKFASSVSFI